MCFVHKHMQNADFGQILCRRASTKRHVTSRPMVRFSQTWYQKMRKTWKKKVTKRRVTICGGREAVADFVQGGQIDPPVKIGLRVMYTSKGTLQASCQFEQTTKWGGSHCSWKMHCPSPPVQANCGITPETFLGSPFLQLKLLCLWLIKAIWSVVLY